MGSEMCIRDRVESVYVNGQEVSITADGNSVTFADSVVETFTSGNLPVSIYTEDKVYTAVISVKKVISTVNEFAALESFVTVKGGNADGWIELGDNIDMENAAVAGAAGWGSAHMEALPLPAGSVVRINASNFAQL